MKIETGLTTEQEDSDVIKTIREQRFKSRFRFLNGHDGIRPGELTCLIGPKGGSKSTMARSIMLENAMQLKRTYAVLSEETVKTYRFEMQRAAKKVAGIFDKDQDLIMENMFFTSLLGLEFSNFDDFKNRFKKILDQLNPDIIYFDNFTTSFICSLPFHFQAKAINFFKSIATERDIPFVLILHTVKGTDIYKRFVEGDDVRADASSVNFGSYNYVISTFFRLKPPKSYIYIDKARYHSNMNKKVFELDYDIESGLFLSDRISSLEEIKDSMQKGDLNKGAKF
jgi:archaellum biogenesis ATPase FlaH